jgi:hypothetical protein
MFAGPWERKSVFDRVGGGHELDPMRENGNKHYNCVQLICGMKKLCEHHGLTSCAKLLLLEFHHADIFLRFQTAV